MRTPNEPVADQYPQILFWRVALHPLVYQFILVFYKFILQRVLHPVHCEPTYPTADLCVQKDAVRNNIRTL